MRMHVMAAADGTPYALECTCPAEAGAVAPAVIQLKQWKPVSGVLRIVGHTCKLIALMKQHNLPVMMGLL